MSVVGETIRWQAFEYLPRRRSRDWFLAVGIIALSLTAISVFVHNLLFAAVVLLGTFSLFLFAKRRPSRLTVLLTKEGVQFGKRQYRWNELESFWVEDRYGEPRLLLKRTEMIAPLLVIPIAEVEPNIIRAFLRDYLVEAEEEEPFSQKIMEYLGF